MKILVTGGAGFIGSRLAKKLLDKQNEVYVIDDLSTGLHSNIALFDNEERFHFINDTILNRDRMAELVTLCDQVYHFAAAVGVRLILEKPVETIETNVIGTELILKLCAQTKTRCMISSTSEVYGRYAENKKDLPLEETDGAVYGPTTASRWSYACSKAIDEFLALAYWRKQELEVTIVRLFNTVGPGQLATYGMVVPNLVRQAITNKPMTVFGDGTQTRSFAHVDDVTDALVDLMNMQQSVGEIYNIGSDKEISIYALAERIKTLAESQSEIVFVSYEDAYEKGFEDMARRVPDIKKLQRTTGFVPRHSLDDILRHVIEYERNRLAATC